MNVSPYLFIFVHKLICQGYLQRNVKINFLLVLEVHYLKAALFRSALEAIDSILKCINLPIIFFAFLVD